jgi:hypothetical protein
MSERKVESFKNPAIFWQSPGTNCFNMAISEKKNIPQNPVTLTPFFHKNPLYEPKKKRCSQL